MILSQTTQKNIKITGNTYDGEKGTQPITAVDPLIETDVEIGVRSLTSLPSFPLDPPLQWKLVEYLSAYQLSTKLL